MNNKLCGIVAVFNIEHAIPIGANILVNQDSRGTDSSGLGYITKKNKLEIQKKALPPKEFIKVLKNKRGIKTLIGHNRNATTNVIERNKDKEAHPFLSENGDFCLVHNGHIVFHDSMRQFLELEGHHFSSGGVDSEVLVHMLEDLLEKYSREESMNRFFSILDGENVLVLFKDNELYGYPANSYFKVIIVDNGVIVASTFDSFAEILKEVDGDVVGYYPDVSKNNHMLKATILDGETNLSLFGDWEEGIFKHEDFIVHNKIMCDYCRESKLTERFNNHDRCLECYNAKKDKTASELHSISKSSSKLPDYRTVVNNKLKYIWGKCEICDSWLTLERMTFCHICNKLLCKACYYNQDIHSCHSSSLY